MRRSLTHGFTLLELAIVLVVVGVLTTGGLVALMRSVSHQQVTETETTLDRLQEALLNYRLTYHRLPCPADIDADLASAEFGRETTPAGTCAGYTQGNVAAGMVPVKALGLSDKDGLDAWNMRIFYAVDTRLTGTLGDPAKPNEKPTLNPFYRTYGINDPSIGAITICTTVDPQCTQRTTRAIYTLVSFGPNGHGAFTRQGNTRKSSGSTDVDEQQNCDCDAEAADKGFNEIFVQKATKDTGFFNAFDDIVRYKERGDLRALYE